MASLALAFDILARDRASAEFAKVGDAADRAGKRGEKFGRVVGAAFVAAGAAAGALAVASVKSASDQNEALTKSVQVFGTASKAVEAFASTSAKQLGLSKTAALDATGTFGNLFVALGIGKKPAADLSINLAKLGADLASFNNTPVDQALTALKSGLLGEAEPLRAFGVSLSAARIEAEALAIGLVKPIKAFPAVAAATIKLNAELEHAREVIKKYGKDSTEAALESVKVQKAQDALAKATAGVVPPLTAAQKAQAAYSIIQKDTAVASGDVARSQDTLAFKQKQLSAQFDDAKARIGTGLIPVILDLLGKLEKLGGFIQRNSDVLVPLVSTLAAAAVTFAIVSKAIAVTNIVLVAMGSATTVALGPVGLIIIAVAALTVGIIALWKSSQTFRTVVIEVFKAVAGFVLLEVSTIILVFEKLFGVLGHLPGKAGEAFRSAEKSAHSARLGVDALRTSIDNIQSMTVTITTIHEAVKKATAAKQDRNTRAHGGPVSAGTSYLVGETEPELFVPAVNGRIYNQRQLAGLGVGGGGRGGTTVNVYPQHANLDPHDLANIMRRTELLYG